MLQSVLLVYRLQVKLTLTKIKQDLFSHWMAKKENKWKNNFFQLNKNIYINLGMMLDLLASNSR